MLDVRRHLLADLNFKREVEVGVCLDGEFTDLPAQFSKSAAVDLAEVVLARALEMAEDHSLVLVVTTISTALASFLQRHGPMIAKKVRHVSIFGTVSPCLAPRLHSSHPSIAMFGAIRPVPLPCLADCSIRQWPTGWVEVWG